MTSAPDAGAADAGPALSADAGWPVWRTRMTKPNALYDISDNAVADPWFFDAGAEVPTQFTNADDALSGSGPSILGYRGGVLFRGCGAFGVLRPGVDLSGAYTASGLVQYVASLNAFVLLSSNSPAEAFWLE